MSGVTVAFILMNPFIEIYTENDLPRGIVFAVFALPLLFAWAGVRRHIGIADSAATASKRGGSKSSLVILCAAFLLMFTIKKMIDIIFHTVEQFDDFLYIPVYLLLQPVLYSVFGFIGDKKKERISVVIAAGLCIISILLAVVAENPLSPVVIPVVPAAMIFYTYIIYFIYVIPIYNIRQAKIPVFLASLSLVCLLLQWLFARLVHPFVPKMLMSVGEPLFVTTTILSVVLLILLHFIFQRRRERTLAASLYALLYGVSQQKRRSTDISPGDEPPDEPETTLTQKISDAGLTRDEIKVALLLVDGESKRDIARKMHINAADFNQHEKSIRQKLNLMSDPDPVIAAVVAEYKLTKRETDVLRYLGRNVGNDEIAAELYLSEDTVKVHVHNLMKKLPEKKRSRIPEWLESYRIKTE
jgi:DNA-binding CsgD family transcriptional regulator